MATGQNQDGFSRPKYFTGQVLSAEDFQAEQEYQNGKRKLLNRCLFGIRIACGLAVKIGKRTVRVQPGVALDCAGNEIYVPKAERIELPDKNGVYYLSIRYTETDAGMVPFVNGEISGETAPTRTQEGYELTWDEKDHRAGHLPKDIGWEACGNQHPVTLARVTIKKGRVKLSVA